MARWGGLEGLEEGAVTDGVEAVGEEFVIGRKEIVGAGADDFEAGEAVVIGEDDGGAGFGLAGGGQVAGMDAVAFGFGAGAAAAVIVPDGAEEPGIVAEVGRRGPRS